MRPGALTVVLTRRCPSRCGFCPQGFEPRDMSAATLAAALRGLGPRLGRKPRIKLFGGEPLLKPGLVRRAVGLVRELGLAADFELGTSGCLLDARMARFLRERPEVEVVFGRSSPWLGRLPRTSLNFVIAPGERAPAVLRRLRSALALGLRSVNFLPAYFVTWSEAELTELRRCFAALARLLRGRPIAVKNLSRWGAVPLYNDGWCVDTDGRVYASNLILVRGAGPHAGPLRLGHVRRPARLRPMPRPTALEAVLRACFSAEALESTRRVDAELTEFIHAL
ncbi:MAG: radical SAM protein [Elusimicrobia bacterium]|nr:radical SAM protein [Elusimicrobiota bacterium]